MCSLTADMKNWPHTHTHTHNTLSFSFCSPSDGLGKIRSISGPPGLHPLCQMYIRTKKGQKQRCSFGCRVTLTFSNRLKSPWRLPELHQGYLLKNTCNLNTHLSPAPGSLSQGFMEHCEGHSKASQWLQGSLKDLQTTSTSLRGSLNPYKCPGNCL